MRKENDRGGRNIFIFRSEIGSVTGGIEGMEEFIASLTQFFTDWGYVGLFLSAFVAGSILPFSSEVVLVILVRMGLDPLLCLFAAASGNTLGGMTCYWIGHLGKRDWITRYLRVEPAKIDRVSRFLEGKGALFAFFTFLPYVGEAVAIVLGLMRSNVWITAVAMFVGKLLRYVAIVAALQECFRGFEAVGCRNLRAARRTAYILLRRE